MGRHTAARSWSSPPPTPGFARRRRRRPLVAALASALMPGAGQLLAGRRRSGVVLLVASVLFAGAVVALVWTHLRGGVFELVAWLLEPRVLLSVAVGNLLLGALRAYATVAAWRAVRMVGGRAGAAQLAGLVAVLAVLVALPHAGVAYAGVQAQRVFDTVFVTPGPTPADGPADQPTPEPAPSPTPAPDPAPAPPPEPSPRATPGPVPDTSPRAPDDTAPPPTPGFASDELFDGDERLNVLLLGSDAGPDRSGTRIDALVVASIDVESGEAVLVSVARNLGGVPLTGVFAARLGERFPDRLMGLYTAAARDPVLAAEFDDPGTAAHVNAVEALLRMDIDHVAKVDLAGFVDVIDALGGVEVDVDRPIRVQLSPPRAGEDWRTYDIPAGRQRLDGHEAHAYVRSRTGSDDYDRMRRQRCLLGSVAAEADTTRLLRALPRLATVLTERVRTDVPTDRLPDLARLAGRIDVPALRTLGLTPPTYSQGLTAGGFHQADVARIQGAVDDLLAGDGPVPRGAADLVGTCG